jgi:site-specific recombinase XerD
MSSAVEKAIEDYEYGVLALSPRTRRWYVEKLRDWAKWLREQGEGGKGRGAEGTDLATLTPADIRRYMGSLRERKNRYGQPLSSYTLRGYAQVVKGFLNWCVKEDVYAVPEKLIARIELPRVDQKVIEVFTRDQLRRLLAATQKEGTRELTVRDQAIIRVLVSTGIRASELCGLRLGDVHMTTFDAHMKVMGKGRKEREVPLGREAKVVLHRYLQTYRRAPAQEQHLFLNRTKTPMTPDGLDAMLYRLRDWSGISGVRCSCHTFRHTFAVEFLRTSPDLYRLSHLLGHSSVKVTEIYLRAVKAADARQGVDVFGDL